ncbi:MAG: penicillin-binding protein activator [Gammaproteobacteria bacterium]
MKILNTHKLRLPLLRNSLISKSLCLTLILLLTACSPLQQDDGQPSGRAAQKMSAKGDHLGASRAYLDLAVNTSGEQRERFVIFAANELFLANDLDGANRILIEVGAQPAEANIDLWAQVTAELRLAENNPEAALDALNKVMSTQSEGVAKRILLLRSDALFQLGDTNTAVATLLQREQLLTRNKDILANHRHIWSGLQANGADIPPNAGQSTSDPILNNWLDLGYVAYSNRTSLTNLNLSLSQWRSDHPDHPASGGLLEEVLDSLSALSNYPARIAVLLPLSGKQKSLGEAIRDGFLAAHFSVGNETQRPEIRFYDTQKNGVAASYQQAVVNGAAFIVGPLLKSQVTELASLSDKLPTLALNYGPADIDYPDRFYQFALAPEDEAREVAIRATAEGQFNAVALVPDSPWGERVLEAFTEQLQQSGGNLLTARAYPMNAVDYAESIRSVLLLDESYARRNRLTANIGEELEFKPRRRQDVDLIFMAANSTKAKQLRPQLRFHYAADIPTYGTSALYKPGSTDNSDINGVLFPDMPWLLKPSQMVKYDQEVLSEQWDKGSVQLSRLIAMGYDAYHLSAALNNNRRVRTVRLQGMSGRLSMNSDGQLHRELVWAKFERGRPRTLPDSQRGLTEDTELLIR